MTTITSRPARTGRQPDVTSPDRPARRPRLRPAELVESGVSALSAAALVWILFRLTGVWAPLAMAVGWLACFILIYAVVSFRIHGVVAGKDRLATLAVWVGAAIAVLPLLAIIAYVGVQGARVVGARFPHFFVADLAGVGPSDPYTKAGVRHAIVGTFEQVGLAMLMTVPLAIMTAVFLTEVPGRFARWVRTIVDAMSGIPSIICGLFVYIVWVQPRHTAGFSGFAAAMAISILMAPTITRTAEEVLRIVPDSLREASLALGAPEWRTTLRVVLPTARAGLVTAVILGVARAVGETAPVLFTAHGSVRVNWNPFHGAQADLPLTVFNLIFSPIPNSVLIAWGGALVLVVIVLTLFTLARILGSGRSRS